MPSQKTAVIGLLWNKLKEEGTLRPLGFDNVKKAIIECNEEFGTRLSSSNPANFMKDLLRGRNASANWPSSLTAIGITGRQLKGGNRIFEFVPFSDKQTEPFPNVFELSGNEQTFTLQSLSLPLTTKSLGRVDESWLVQVAVNLRVVEAHFANMSALDVLEVVHLQVGVKLGKSEIDSIFLAVIEIEGGERVNALVTCEAKQANDPILADQIVQQVVAAYLSTSRLGLDIRLIIPVAIKAVKGGSIFVVEFEPWTPAEASVAESDLKELRQHSAALYALRPMVPGIGFSTSRERRAPRKPVV